ncbi:transposase [Endozoicomonas atrinae]|uniref:transposase n=1 Tax=Endozoicomonas atrinae TaxID=1333660 RepID=UPI0008249BFC|nr:transposase [Endozoicomonas atrinae]
MSVEINEKLVDQIASQIKTQDDLADFSRLLIKATVERVMAAELEEHLGYAKYSPEGHNTGNSRNGSTSKNIKGDFGEVEVKVPRDRNGDFVPQLIAKGQTRLNKLSLYCL